MANNEYFRGTTPTFIFTFPTGFHPSDASKVVVTFSVNGYVYLELSENDITISNDTISVFLSQAQTIRFPDGNMTIQINFVYSNGNRVATKKQNIKWEQNLHNGVIEV